MSTKRRKGGRRAQRPRRLTGRGSARSVRARRTSRGQGGPGKRSGASRRPRPRRVRARAARRPASRSLRHPPAKSRPRPSPARSGVARALLPSPVQFLPRGGNAMVVTSARQNTARPGLVPVRPGASERNPATPANLGNGPATSLARPAIGPARAQPAAPAGAITRPAPAPQTFRSVTSSTAPAPTIDRRPARRPVLAARKRDVCAMILAAGLGKRMLSQSSKLVHNVAGRPMVRHVVEAARAAGVARTVVVSGNQADEVRRAVGENDKRVGFAYQDAQRGTGHAVLSAERHLAEYEGDVLILNGDLPVLRPDTLTRFADFHRSSGAPFSLVTAAVESPAGYGRIIRTYNGDVSRIVEEADATAEERAIKEINCGIYCVDVAWLWDPLKRARADNAQREIYLTDLVEILRRDDHKVAAYRHPEAEEVLGVNDRRELASATRALHRRKANALMVSGVTILDPETTYVDVDVKVGQDTILEPGVMLLGATEIGRGVTIGAGSRITDSVVGDGTALLPYCVVASSRIGRACRIGPFAHLRPDTQLDEEARIGNFVETKKIRMGQGSK